MKKFPDAPESRSVPVNFNNLLYGGNNKNIELPSTINNKSDIGKGTPEEEDQGKEYVFNDFTAGAYQEFDVVKINKYNQKQDRLLGVDRYHIYNDLPKTKEKNSNKFLLFYLFKIKKLKKQIFCLYLHQEQKIH